MCLLVDWQADLLIPSQISAAFFTLLVKKSHCLLISSITENKLVYPIKNILKPRKKIRSTFLTKCGLIVILFLASYPITLLTLILYLVFGYHFSKTKSSFLLTLKNTFFLILHYLRLASKRCLRMFHPRFIENKERPRLVTF